MTKPTVLVRIDYSENHNVNAAGFSDGFYPIEKVNKVLKQVDSSNRYSDRGYDKTGFTLLVWDGSDDDLSEYNGRIDLGDGYNSYNILQEHVQQHCEWVLNNKDNLPFGGAGKEAEEYQRVMNWWLDIARSA